MSSEVASTVLPPPLLVDKAVIAKASPRVQTSARWFWWIAGLSLINSAVVMTGGEFHFVLGLAVTQVFDALLHEYKILAAVLDIVPLAFFFAAGMLAKKGFGWAFVVGGVAYLCDGVIFALVGDWIPVAFHLYALFWIFQGWKELRVALNAACRRPNQPPEPTIMSVTPPAAQEPRQP
jgi:hypothetical protein